MRNAGIQVKAWMLMLYNVVTRGGGVQLKFYVGNVLSDVIYVPT